VVFAQTVFTRAVDPVIPMIAEDFAIDVKTAALLSSAYTFPYALVQPALGVTGDFLGKTRLMNLCVLVVALSALVCAVATTFSLLVVMRIVAGLVAGGVFPIALALIGDLVPVSERQIAIGRLLAVGLTGNLVGASIAGVIGDVFGWRGVFAILGAFGFIVAIAAFFAFRGRRRHRRLSIARQCWPISAASLPIRAPRSASRPCSSKQSSSTGSFLTSLSCCSPLARPAPRSLGF
jgi:predicted MFS family arabinose efflux permease